MSIVAAWEAEIVGVTEYKHWDRINKIFINKLCNTFACFVEMDSAFLSRPKG